MNHSLITCALLVAAAAAWLPNPAAAQIRPEDTVRKIADDIAREMAEIDRLLLESSRAKGAAPQTGQAADKIRELIDATRQSQGQVVQGIDDLIDELQKMAQQSQQQSSSQQPPQDQQGQQDGGQPQDREGQQQQPGEQRGQGARREIDTPDVAQQPGQQPGEPGQEPSGQEPNPEGQTAAGNERDPTDPGANRRTGGAADGGTERVDRASDAATWGELQKYLPPQYQRAGAPEVPAKYRRLHEAFQKQANRTGQTDRGGPSGSGRR